MAKRKRREIPKYEDYQRMIYHSAHHWSSVLDLPFDELVSLNNLIFCESIREWNPKRSPSFSTFLTVKLRLSTRRAFLPAWNGFSGKSESEHIRPIRYTIGFTEFTEEDVPHPDNCPYRNNVFKETVENLSPSSQHIVALLLEEDPSPTLGVTGKDSRKKIKGAITQHLRDEGWSWGKISTSFREIKGSLRSIQKDDPRIRGYHHKGEENGRTSEENEGVLEQETPWTLPSTGGENLPEPGCVLHV